MDTWTCIHVGCPIRISAGRWIFAPNRSFSQLITSFVGSQCQGILLVLFLAWPLCLNLLELFEIVRLSSFNDTHNNFSHSVSFDTSLLSQCISSIQFSKYNLGFAKLGKNTSIFAQIYLKQLYCLILFWTRTTSIINYIVRARKRPERYKRGSFCDIWSIHCWWA